MTISFFFFFFKIFIHLFLFLVVLGFIAALGLSLVAESGGSSSFGAWALGLWASVTGAHGLYSAGSAVVMHRISCFAACGIFLDPGSIPCPLCWQAES